MLSQKFRILVCVLVFGALSAPAIAQTNTPKKGDKAAAYYHYSLGHLYSELAAAYGNKGDYLTRAIDSYKLALKADPGAVFITEELSDLYIQSGKLRDAVTEAEEILRQNPNDVGARRILGRIYTRLIGDSQGQQNKINEEMLRKAVEQYTKIAELQPDDVDTWLMLGRLQKISQNSVEAEKAYKKALELEPDNEDAMTGLAVVYADLGDSKRASELLQQVVAKNPSLRTLTALAGQYEQQRDYALAAETLRKTLEIAPGNIEVKKLLAQNLLMSDKTEEALKLYEELAAEDPKDATTWLRISAIYRQKKDFDKARDAIAKARAIDANNLDVRYADVNLLESEGKQAEALAAMKELVASTARRNYSTGERANRVVLLERLGLMYRNAEQYDEAVAAFRQISELDPDLSGRAGAQIADTFRLSKQFDKALEQANAAYKKNPNDRVLRAVRASILAEVGKSDESVSELKKLLDGKNDRETYIALAQVYEKSKNYGEMAKVLDEADKLSADKEDRESVAFMRGAMYEKMKNYDAAEAEFRKVIEMNPKNASALNYLGYMLADRNVKLQEALRLIQQAVDIDPNNGAYLDSLGWAYYRVGNLQEAEQNLQRAMERFSKDPTVHDHLGDVYFRLGRVRDAIAQWQNSLTEWQRTSASESDPAEVAKIQKKLESAKVRLAKETSNKAQQ